MTDGKKHVVVLAHADAWGILSANKVVKALHERYPDDVAIHLIVSNATRTKDGSEILTKVEDLKASRELKEPKMLEYFDHLDFHLQGMVDAGHIKALKYDTFSALAKKYCADGEVHYTARGGPKGGEEAAEFVRQMEARGEAPEVVLSVDTMAILPESVTGRYPCFSTHPGPLDTIKVAGMQGTLRSMTEQVLYHRDGKPITKQELANMWPGAPTYLKGTLFMQLPELDKGPAIATTLSYTCPGMCAHQARDEVYNSLTDAMLERLPEFLDKEKRDALIAKAIHEKEEIDKLPHYEVPELNPEKFARWQTESIGVPGGGPHGLEIIQNEVVSSSYFRGKMKGFFPKFAGSEDYFEGIYNKIFGSTLEKMQQQKEHYLLQDPWAAFYAGVPGVKITQMIYGNDGKETTRVFENPPADTGRSIGVKNNNES